MYEKKVSSVLCLDRAFDSFKLSIARNLASIRATPEIHADITQFFETIASSLLDYASTLEIGEEISLKISKCIPATMMNFQN